MKINNKILIVLLLLATLVLTWYAKKSILGPGTDKNLMATLTPKTASGSSR